MTLDKIMVIIFSLMGIFFSYWFFLMKKEKVTVARNSVDILVKGGYKPDIISIPYGKKTTLNFIRKDSSSCLEDVVIADFKIKKYLPLGKKVSIEIIPNKKGSFNFECAMNMFHGKLIVE